MADWGSQLPIIKNTSTTPFYPFLSLPYCSSRLPARFGSVLGGLADPRTIFTCPSPTTGVPRRSSWTFFFCKGTTSNLCGRCASRFCCVWASSLHARLYAASDVLALTDVWSKLASTHSKEIEFLIYPAHTFPRQSWHPLINGWSTYAEENSLYLHVLW